MPVATYHESRPTLLASYVPKTPLAHTSFASSQAEFHPVHISPSNSLLLGLYRDEGEELHRSCNENDTALVAHFSQVIHDRLTEHLQAFRYSPTALQDIQSLVIRDPHDANISSSIAQHPEFAEILARLQVRVNEIISLRLEEVAMSGFMECYPQAAFPLSAIVAGSNLRSVTLHDCIVPWSLFGSLSALESLDLKTVEVFGYNPIHPAPTPRPLSALRYQNSSDVVEKLVRSRTFGFETLVLLCADCGSGSARELAMYLIRENAYTLRELGLKFEPNSDDEQDPSANAFDISKLQLPLLHTIEIGDAYNLTSIAPLSSALKVINQIASNQRLYTLSQLRLVLRGLPLPSTPSPHEFDLDTRSYLFQNILNNTLACFDSALSELFPSINVSLHFGWEPSALQDPLNFNPIRQTLLDDCAAEGTMHVEPMTGVATFWSAERGALGALEHDLPAYGDEDATWAALGVESDVREYLENKDSECLVPAQGRKFEVGHGVLRTWFPRTSRNSEKGVSARIVDVETADGDDDYPVVGLWSDGEGEMDKWCASSRSE